MSKYNVGDIVKYNDVTAKIIQINEDNQTFTTNVSLSSEAIMEEYVTIHSAASGNYSHAEGYSTSAPGENSHAEGRYASAYGRDSHAEGYSTLASGNCSHAEGLGTEASGENSHAEGWLTIASGADSHAEGNHTIASNGQHAQGRFNIEDTSNTYAHIVGNGSSFARSNAHTLDWDGNAWFEGDIYVGSTSGTNKDDGSKKLATEEYVDNSGGVYYANMASESSLQQIDLEYSRGKSIVLTQPYSGAMIPQSAAISLPSDYTSLEYIETDGNAYINTEYYPNEKTLIQMDFQFTRDVAAHIFGARTASQNDAFAVCWESDFAWCVQINDSIYNGGTFDRAARHKVNLSTSTFQVDGDVTASILDYTPFTCGGPLYIAACSNSTIPDENMTGKIYQFAIIEEDELKSLFVPAKNAAGAIGLYDLLQKRFFSSAGSQAFTAGPELNVHCNMYQFTQPTSQNGNVAIACCSVVPQNNYLITTTVNGSRLIGPTQGTIYHNFSTVLAADNGYYRPIRVSTQEPTASDGNIGDIWIVYAE